MNKNESHTIKGLRTGSESSYEELFEAYYRPLAIFAMKYVGDLEIAKEIVQDFFVHLYENRRALVITTSLKSYLYRSIRNRCLNHLKHSELVRQHMSVLGQAYSSEEDPETRILETELENRIFQIVEGLPPRCREIFILSRVKGIKNKEIAAKLDISIRTVETQISLALKELRATLGSDLIS